MVKLFFSKNICDASLGMVWDEGKSLSRGMIGARIAIRVLVMAHSPPHKSLVVVTQFTSTLFSCYMSSSAVAAVAIR
jgi:hypothetical protein